MSTGTGISTSGKLRDWLANPDVAQTLSGAIAGWMEPEQFNAQILIAMEQPELAECSPRSKFEAVHLCAALGLLPTFQQVALIPRDMKGEGMIVSVMPQWQGYKAIMERHPDVLELSHDLVHPGDEFFFDQELGKASHVYNPFDPKREFSKVDADHCLGGYVKIQFRDRGRPPRHHFMTIADIIKRRACAQTTNVWDKWPKEQMIKSLYRDCYARRVLSVDPLVNQRAAALVEHDDSTMGNDPNRVQVVNAPALPSPAPPSPAPPPPALPAPAPSRTKHLSQKLSQKLEHEPPPPHPPQQEMNPSQKRKPKKSTKRKPAPEDDAPIPPLSEVPKLQVFAAQLEMCTSADAVQLAFITYVDDKLTTLSLTKEEYKSAENARDQTLAYIKATPQTQETTDDISSQY